MRKPKNRGDELEAQETADWLADRARALRAKSESVRVAKELAAKFAARKKGVRKRA